MLLFELALASHILEGDAPFQCTVFDYSDADWDGCCDHLRCSNGGYLVVSTAAYLFCEWVNARNDISLSHCKYSEQESFISLSYSCSYSCHSS